MTTLLSGHIFGRKLSLSEVEHFKSFRKYMAYLDFDNGIERAKMISSKEYHSPVVISNFQRISLKKKYRANTK